MNHLSNETLIDYLHGELRAHDDAAAHAHLSSCATCRAERDQEVALRELIRSGAATEEREFPSLIAAAVWQQIREAPPSPLARFAALWRPAIAVPAAALLLVGGWLASPLSHGSSPSVDALYYFQAHAAQSASSPLSEHSGMPAAAETTLSDETVPDTPPLVGQYAAYAIPGGIDAVR